MPYVSPLHIAAGLTDDATTELSAGSLVRLRKRLLAELDLSGEIGLTIRGTVYTKDAIIKAIDQLMQNADLELHGFIYRHSFLLDYLEDEAHLIDIKQYATLAIPEDIRQKLDLLLSERVILQFKKGISSRKFAVAEQALVLMNFLESNLRLACYEEVYRSLTAFYHFLWELKQRINRHSENEIGFLSYGSLALFLNALPDSFSEVKRNLIGCCISIVVLYDSFSDHNHTLVIDISNVLLQLECEEEQALLIRSNHNAFSIFRVSSTRRRLPPVSEQKTSPATSNLDYRAFLWLIVAIIFVSVLGNLIHPEDNYENEDFVASSQNLPSLEQNTVDKTINDFKSEILKQAAAGGQSSFADYTEPVYPFSGLSPFKDPKFYTDNADFKEWTQSLHLNNKTGYDLVVFRFDSLRSGLSTVFIPKGVSSDLTFGDLTRFAFYFGNALMTKQPEMYNGPRGQEFFTKLHTNSDKVLLKDYKIMLKQNRQTLREITLDLKPDFLNDPKNEYRFAAFSLSAVKGTLSLSRAEVMPTFPGGSGALERYIQDHLQYPESAIDRGITGKALIRFVVNVQGNVSEASVIQGVPDCRECDEEALRVIKAMPAWTPGMQDGKAVPVFFTIPIRFNLY